MQALSADKTTISRLVTVVQRIPGTVVDAIGPAPGTGRDRWVELAALFHQGRPPEDLAARLQRPAFRAADSDARFLQVFGWAASPPPRAPARDAAPLRQPAAAWAHSSGARVLTVRRNERATLLAIDQTAAPGFDDFLLGQMEELYSRFLAEAPAGRRKPRGR